MRSTTIDRSRGKRWGGGEAVLAGETVAAREAEAASFEILDAAPEVISRPLSLVAGQGHAAAWVYGRSGQRALVIARDDAAIFSSEPIAGAEPLSSLGAAARLPEVVAEARGWSGAGLKRFLAGERPSPGEVFRRVTAVVDHFMDFDRSLDSQAAMCELIACHVLATYFLDAFPVIGYLWSNGEKGSGKSRLLEVTVELAYLGHMILGSSSVPTLRDLADYGATLALDDAEGLADPRRTDPDKRALFLAGNRKGSTIAVKEQAEGGWRTRHVRTFCPRLFSAIRLPDDILASRTILVPLVKSGDKRKTDRNPADGSVWPHPRRRLVDDLWACALLHLRRLQEHDARAAAGSSLAGRSLEPWRAIFAVAHWLEAEHGAPGLFGRLQELALRYQEERKTLEKTDLTRLAIAALCEEARRRGPGPWAFSTAELTERVNALAEDQDLVIEEDGAGGKGPASAVKIGRLLERLRLARPECRIAERRRWLISGPEVEKLCRTHGLALPGRPGNPFPAT